MNQPKHNYLSAWCTQTQPNNFDFKIYTCKNAFKTIYQHKYKYLKCIEHLLNLTYVLIQVYMESLLCNQYNY